MPFRILSLQRFAFSFLFYKPETLYFPSGFFLILYYQAVFSLIACVVLSATAAPLSQSEALALQDLCTSPNNISTNNLWADCSDAGNACDRPSNWTGVTCNAAMDSIISMCDLLQLACFDFSLRQLEVLSTIDSLVVENLNRM